MAEVGDVLQEWHKAKPSEKLLIVGISVAALGIAIYFHSQTKASTTPTNPVGGDAGNTPTVQAGGTPSNGNPVPAGTPTPTPAPGTGSTRKPPTGSPPPKKVLLPHAPVQVAHPVSRGTVVTRVAQRSAPIHGTTAVVTRSTYIPAKPKPTTLIGTGRTRITNPVTPHGHTGITNPYVGLNQPKTYAGNPGSSTGATPTHGRVA